MNLITIPTLKKSFDQFWIVYFSPGVQREILSYAMENASNFPAGFMKTLVKIYKDRLTKMAAFKGGKQTRKSNSLTDANTEVYMFQRLMWRQLMKEAEPRPYLDFIPNDFASLFIVEAPAAPAAPAAHAAPAAARNARNRQTRRFVAGLARQINNQNRLRGCGF